MKAAGLCRDRILRDRSNGEPEQASEYSAATRRYSAGASAEWRLIRGFGFELDVLYRRMGCVGIVSTFGNGILMTSAFERRAIPGISR